MAPPLIERVRRRKLVQWTLAYLGGAWLLLQLLSLLGEQFGWPLSLLRSVTILLAVGLLAVLVAAWYHGEKGRQRVGGVELLMLTGILVIAGAAVALVRGNAGIGPADGTREAAGAWDSVGARVLTGLTTTRLTAAAGLEAEPAWSPDGRSLAYVSDRSGNRDIWVRLLEGEELRTTVHEGDDSQPSWSPDGRRLVFVSSRDYGRRLDQSVQFGYSLNGGIWTIPAFGGSPSRVLENGFNPDWSPDGRRIAFDGDLDGPRRIWTATPEGEDARRVSTDRSEGAAHTRPRWSPNGRWIVYERQAGSLGSSVDIQVVAAEGGTPVSITRSEWRDLTPAWIDDVSIVFASDRGGAMNLWMVGFDPSAGDVQGEPVQLTTGAGFDVDPTVAPGGTTLAYASMRYLENLWTVELDPERLVARGEARPLSAAVWNDVAPALSPDGKTLVFVSDRGGTSDLWILEPPSDSPRRLTSEPGREMQPSWSPDGSRILFFSDRSGNEDIWMVPASGGAPLRLSEDPADDINPYWSPDGDRIAFMSDRTGRQEIWTMAADGSERRRVTDIGVTAHTARWSPDGQWILFTSMAEGDRDIYVVRPADGLTRRLTDQPSQDAHGLWSPDGRTVVYLADHRLVLAVPLDGGEPRLVYDPGASERIDYLHLSADGRTLIFTRQKIEGDLWRIDGLKRFEGEGAAAATHLLRTPRS
ncbi:MAG: hypothetical protein ACE5JR_11550 [Gemmatimonadota bacterium]